MNSVVRKELWLVSFGDLVTLMVCFFVALMAGQHGKALAQGGGEHVVELTMNDFNTSGTELSSNGVNQLNQLKVLSQSKLTIHGCDGPFNSTQLARTLAVARQFPVTPVQGSVLFGRGECAQGSVLRVLISR